MTTGGIIFVLVWGLSLGGAVAYAVTVFLFTKSNKVGDNIVSFEDSTKRSMQTIREYECSVKAMEKEIKQGRRR